MRLTPPARLALFSLAAALLAGCYPTYYYPPPPPIYGFPGNIYVSWTFAGASCAQTPGVVQVVVNVLNDPLPIVPNTFACQVGSPPNQLAIYNYNPGTYNVVLSGLDVNGKVIWTGSSTVVVNGNVATVVNMQPTAPANSALLSWSFAPRWEPSFHPVPPPVTRTRTASTRWPSMWMEHPVPRRPMTAPKALGLPRRARLPLRRGATPFNSSPTKPACPTPSQRAAR